MNRSEAGKTVLSVLGSAAWFAIAFPLVHLIWPQSENQDLVSHAVVGAVVGALTGVFMRHDNLGLKRGTRNDKWDQLREKSERLAREREEILREAQSRLD